MFWACNHEPLFNWRVATHFIDSLAACVRHQLRWHVTVTTASDWGVGAVCEPVVHTLTVGPSDHLLGHRGAV